MIYIELFLAFLKIGALSFGGGYGMISLIREQCLSAGWLTEEQLLDFIAVSESTPGPIAVNMATFVGSSQGGVWGALISTLGVVLPSFVIILIIAAVMGKLMKFAGVKATLEGVHPAICALVCATAAIMALSSLFAIDSVKSGFFFDWKSATVLAILAAVYILYRVIRKKNISPILLIILSGVIGVFLF